MVTHALSYLPYFDYIYVMHEGRVVSEGSYKDLLKEEVIKGLHVEASQQP